MHSHETVFLIVLSFWTHVLWYYRTNSCKYRNFYSEWYKFWMSSNLRFWYICVERYWQDIRYT